METPQRKVFYRDENILFEYEILDRIILIHNTMYKFSASIYKQALRIFALFLNQCQHIDDITILAITSNTKYADMFGGKQIGHINYLGKNYEVFEWVI
jgi:hypothetical protein